MKEKVKCKKCSLLIDEDAKFCPYCGYDQTIIDVTPDEEVKSDEEIIKKCKPIKEKKVLEFFNYERKDIRLPYFKHILLILSTLIFSSILSLLFSLIISNINSFFLTTTQYTAALNFSIYLIIFGFDALVLGYTFVDIFMQFGNKKAILTGLLDGFVLLFVSILISNITSAFYDGGVNNNETAIDSITTLYPILSLIIFGFIGPLCEEFAYRIGLFSILSKHSRILGYAVVTVVFGLIHFDFTSSDIVNELINLPNYMIAGLLLCYFYEKDGIVGSSVAHMTNNFVSILITIIYAFI